MQVCKSQISGRCTHVCMYVCMYVCTTKRTVVVVPRPTTPIHTSHGVDGFGSLVPWQVSYARNFYLTVRYTTVTTTRKTNLPSLSRSMAFHTSRRRSSAFFSALLASAMKRKRSCTSPTMVKFGQTSLEVTEVQFSTSPGVKRSPKRFDPSILRLRTSTIHA